MTNRHWYENLAEIIFGGNGIDRYGDGDIICHTSDNLYQMPDDVREATMVLLEDAIIEKCRNGQVFENNRQIRLKSAWITSFDSSSDGTNKPLHLDVEQTGYFATYCTNARLTDNPLITLPDSLTIGEKYAGDIRLSESRLSDPIAVNLSVVTIDGKIHVGKRSSQNAINSKAKYQPAVSGNGSIKDDIIEGNYDPFLTAIRESMEEVTGRNFRPERTMITFFGYAKTLKTRFPFLFGELRLPITSLELKALATQRKGNWEGRIEEDCVIPFTVVDVVDWISKHRNVPAIGTTLFSLYQSLIYQYPNKIGNICDRLEKEEYRERTASEETMLKIFELLVLPEMLISTKALKSVNEAAVIMIKKTSNIAIARSLGWKDATRLSQKPYKEFIALCREIQNTTNDENRKTLKKAIQRYLSNAQEKYEERLRFGSGITCGNDGAGNLLDNADSETRTISKSRRKPKPKY